MVQQKVKRNFSTESFKCSLISEGILILVPLQIKSAKLLPWTENLNMLFTVLCWKFKFSDEGSSDQTKQCFTVLPKLNRTSQSKFTEPKPNRTEHVKGT